MPTLKDAILPVAYSARAIAGKLGFRPHTVAVVNVNSSGTHTGDGTRTETVTAITEADSQPPKVRWLKDDEIALAAGALPSGSVEIGPITPSFSGGGTELATINGSDLAVKDVRLIRITGPMHPTGADYTVVGVQADRALRYMIRAVPVGSR
jgi:hypothetical protein